MQTVFKPQPNTSPQSGGRSQSPSIIFIALTFFALAGLMIGFAVGTFTHRNMQAANSNKGAAPVVAQTAGPKQTPTVDVVAIGVGCPQVPQYSLTEVADNTTSYTVDVQPMDTSIEKVSSDNHFCGKGKQLNASGLTCRLWLMRGDLNPIPQAILQNVAAFPDTFPQEIPNALNFTGSQQTQPCSTTGQTVWNYTVSSSVKSGTYFLEILTDWQGKVANWSWRQITISKPGGG